MQILYKQTVYLKDEMVKTLKALYANSMLMFRLIFFHIKNPPKRALSCCNVFFQANLRKISPHNA